MTQLLETLSRRVVQLNETDVSVLAEAVAGGEEVLVTGDRDLLEITDKLPIRILSPHGLWEQLRDDAAADR